MFVHYLPNFTNTFSHDCYSLLQVMMMQQQTRLVGYEPKYEFVDVPVQQQMVHICVEYTKTQTHSHTHKLHLGTCIWKHVRALSLSTDIDIYNITHKHAHT